MSFYLRHDGKWCVLEDDRWQFLANEMPELPLMAIVCSDSDILTVCKLADEEADAFCKAQKMFRLRPESQWGIFREVNRGKKEG